MKKIHILFVILAASISVAKANANEPGIVIIGDVQDQSGKPVVGSKIYVTNVCTNQVMELRADSLKGTFEFRGDFCGTYLVEAKANGYKNTVKVVESGDGTMLLVNVKMENEKAEAPVKKENLRPAES